MPRKPARSKTYQVGDRVQPRRAYGVTGRVVEIIRRNTHPLLSYRIRLRDGQEVVLPASEVEDPPRPLLEEYRTWLNDGLGPEYIALLDDKRLAQLQREWAEAYPQLAATRPDWIPRRVEGVQPVHRVTITKTTRRELNVSSNGAFIRHRNRHVWWLKCPCGLVEMAESAQEARRRKAEHDTPLADTEPVEPSV